MVDCFDRIAVQMTEIALEPVRLLGERSMQQSVGLRVVSGGRRFIITIAKRFPDHPQKPTYLWKIHEVDATGERLPNGASSHLTPGNSFDDAETAYWSAVDGLCQINLKR